MQQALREAVKALEKGEVPIGSVIVNNGKIVGRGHNQTKELKDPTAHAEIIAITAACNTLETDVLDTCSIYVTIEPCVMCTGAILLAKMKSLIFGAFEPKFGACGSLYNIATEKKYNHSLKVISGILEEETSSLIQNFLKSKRK